MPRARRRSSVLALALAALAACEAPATPSPAPTSTPLATGPAAALPSDAPSAGALAAEELPAANIEIAAGRYTRRGFEPRITFEVVGETWRAVQTFAGFFDIQQDVGSPDVIAVQFARPEGIYGAAGQAVAAPSAADAGGAVQANPGLEVLAASDSLMSGLTGIVVEVENPTSATEHVRILDVPPGPLGIDPGRRLWIAFFDTPDGLLAIMVGGSVAMWEEALLAAEPVLETVTIGQ